MPVAPIVSKSVEIPKDVQAKLDNRTLKVTGPKGVLERTFKHPRIAIAIQKDHVEVKSELPKKKEGALVGTWAAHIKNMVLGTTHGFEYKMKIVYSHFPIKTTVKGSEFVIENFLGESHPRIAKIVGETKIDIKGDTVTLSGINLEDVSQSCANIELATKIKGYDPKVFQDGIYLFEKGLLGGGE
jgi:large subunit ribosomal protein L6